MKVIHCHGSGDRAQQALTAELALGLLTCLSPSPRLLHSPTPTPLPCPCLPAQAQAQPGYPSCRSEAWSLQENTGPCEPGFSVMF